MRIKMVLSKSRLSWRRQRGREYIGFSRPFFCAILKNKVHGENRVKQKDGLDERKSVAYIGVR